MKEFNFIKISGWKQRAKGAIIACILSLELPLLTFLLLTVFHLFIRHYIFKDRVGKNEV